MSGRREKDPGLTPEQFEELRQWIEEMNEIATAAPVDLDGENGLASPDDDP